IDGLFERLGHAHREVLKIKHLQRQHFTGLRVIGSAAGLGHCPVVLVPCTSSCSMAFWAFCNHFFGRNNGHAAHSLRHQYLRSYAARSRHLLERRAERAGDHGRQGRNGGGNAHPSIDGLRQSHHNAPINATLISARSVRTPTVSSTPRDSISKAPPDGAKAWMIRLGNANLPISRGNRIGPNKASGSVPRPIQEIPYPAPYSRMTISSGGTAPYSISKPAAISEHDAIMVQTGW